MKKLILIVCMFTALAMQSCVATYEPAGGYYYRDGFWYFRDGGGREHRDHQEHHAHEEHEHADHEHY